MYKKAIESGDTFDAVILDLTIRGGMGGKETVGRLHAMDSRVKAIVSSVYSADPVISNYRTHGFHGVLIKPYQVNDLRIVLDEVLTSQSETGVSVS